MIHPKYYDVKKQLNVKFSNYEDLLVATS